jgi:alanyl-tRNA synthetase
MTSSQIRQQFIDFFVQKHGHTFVPSSPVVPHDDPTLLFTNAGMNQFKPYFLGQAKAPWPRTCNTQKCIRAGGKHNDLDDVGRSRRHHTFFEMLGNWSFGDYFKAGAIEMAWELLTKVWKLDPTRLHVSCYEGNEAARIPRDTEAADLWKKIAGVADDHIHYFGKDNFWEMGDTGPCGRSTEIYVDRRPQAELDADKAAGRKAPVNGEDPRVMEIWNLVFIQYNRDAAGALTPLPAQHVDTGMGLERICQVIQGKDDNFATDLWTPLFEKISEISNLKYTGKFTKTNSVDPQAEAADPQLRHDIAFRVVADHARCLTFALTDGAVPSNEGRGYVLRRILRRAVRFGRQQLGLNEPFMHKLVPVIVESMGAAFGELKRNPGRVAELIKEEEESFGRTLDRGIVLFNEAAQVALIDATDGWVESQPKKMPMIPAEPAFRLHDTFGFPIDLTRIMAEERGMTVDISGYEKLMEEAKEKARAGGRGEKTLAANLPPDAIATLQGKKISPTNDTLKYGDGREIRQGGKVMPATVLAIWDGSKFLDEVPGRSQTQAAGSDGVFSVILDHTAFYAEMGGQVGDQGELLGGGVGTTKGGGANFIVKSTHAIGGYVLHTGFNVAGPLRVGTTVDLRVSALRQAIEMNHTSTHLANWALREVLGEGVQQKGSLVDGEKLRFDFSHGQSLTDEQLQKVESLVDQEIARKLPVYAEEAPQEQALKINGLRAVFGEKYPPMVRVVSIGAPVKDLLADPTNQKWRQYSIEFCGGTHLKNSADAQHFAIIAEESVSKGVRRIVGVTGQAARQAAATAQDLEATLDQASKATDAQLPGMITSINAVLSGQTLPLHAKRKAQQAVLALQKRVKTAEKSAKSQGDGQSTLAAAQQLLAQAAELGGGKIIVGEIPNADDDQLRGALDSLKKKVTSFGILLGAVDGEKVNFVAAVSDDLIATGLKAGDWVREAAKVAGGGGGGRPQMAQAGGKDPSKLVDALEKARAFAASVLK